MAKAGTVIVDFTDAEGGNRIRVPEDDYRCKVLKIEGPQPSKSSGDMQLVWTFAISAGDHKGKEFKDYTPLTKKSAWKLKNILEAMGISVPSKKVALQYKKYIGNELGVTLADEEYKNRISSKPADYISLDVLDADEDGAIEVDEDEVEEAPKSKKSKKDKKGKKGKKGKKAAPADDDDEDVEELDLDEI